MRTNPKPNTKHRDAQSKTGTRAAAPEKTTYQSMAGILERIGDGFVALDYEMNFAYVNKRGGELLGRHPKDLIGKNYWNEYPEAKGTPLANAYLQALEMQNPIVYEGYFAPWSRWFENRIYPSSDGLSILFQDITEHKRTEETLRENEERYRALFEAARDVIFTLSVDGRFTSLNPSFEVFTGWQREEWLGRSFEGLVAGTDISQVRDQFNRILNGEILRSMRLHVHHRSGKQMVVELNMSALTVNNRTVGILGIARDMTEEQHAEDALKASERRFRTLIENSWDAFALFGADGTTLYASPSTSQIIGYSPNEVVGRNAFEFIHQDDQHMVRDRLNMALEQPGAHINIQARILHKNHTWRWLEGVFTNLLDEPGVQAIVNNYHDFTERKHAEALQAAIYQISEAANKATNLDELYRAVHAIIGEVMPARNFYIALYDAENDLLSFPYYVDEVDGSASIPAAKAGRGMTEYILRTGKPLLSDIANFEELAQRGEVELIGAASPIWVGAPLIIEGRTIGVIAMQDYNDPAVYTERELRMLEYVSGQVAKAIERTRLNSEIQRRNQILSALQESMLVLMERRKLTDVLQLIVNQMVQLMGTPNGFLYLVEPDGKALNMRVGLGNNTGHIGLKLKLGEGLAGKVWNTGQPLIVQDYHTWGGRSRQFEKFEIHAMAGVPLTSGSQTIGVLGVDYMEGEQRITQEDVELLTRFAQLASVALENAQFYQTAKDELNERIRAEAALRENEAKYRQLVERLPLVVYTSELGAAGVWRYVSPQIESLLGFTPEEWIADPNLWYQQIHPEDRDRQVAFEEQAYKREEAFDTEYRIKSCDGRELWVRDTAHFLPPYENGSPIVQGVLVDITERKRAEEALHESEETTRLIIDTALDAVITIDQDGQITRWNDQAEIIFGWKRAEAVGQRLSKLIIPPDLRASHERGLKHYLETGEGPVLDKRIEIMAQRRNGDVFPVELTIHALKTNERVSFAAFVRDITERKQAEEALSKAHDDLERLVQERTAELSQANTLLQTMLDHVPDHIFFKDLQSRFLRNSRSQAEMLGLSDPSEVVGKSDFDFFPHAQKAYKEEQSIIRSGRPMVDFEEHVIWPDGRETWVSTTKVPLRDESGRIVGTFGIARDITERKRADKALRKAKDELELRVAERTAALNKINEQLKLELGERQRIEESLRAAEARYRSLVEQLPIVVYVSPATDICSTTYISPQIKTFLGYTQEEWLGDPRFWTKILHQQDRPRVLAQFERADKDGEPPDLEYRMIAKDGSVIWIRENATLLRDADGSPLLWQGLMIDITERKQAEEALKLSETRYRLASRATKDAIWDLDMVNELYTWNENVESLFGYTPDETSSDKEWWYKHIHPADYERVLSGLKAFYEGSDTIWADEYRFLRRDGSVAYITDRGYVERNTNGKPLRMIGAMSDITARKLAEVQIRRRVDYLKTLRIIDMTITASTDLHFSLQTILRQAISQLQVDAADILLLNPTTHILEYSDGIGFYTKAIERSSVRIGEGYAGQAALERKMVNIHSLYESRESINRRLLLDGENFTGYYGVPLIAKGEIKGVLEVFHRTRLDVDQEWVDFLDALAGQAGLAVDNATLFQDLQRINLELSMAYESTLEGWSAALDLRDKETEGHTLRVTNLTLQLAEHMGLKDKDLIHIRRGALLHDIGKMGVPDRILLKPDTLTDEEWEIMRRHPSYAHEMLSRIEYLRPALSIPYCHHEKWNGSGYPRGLGGEEIPLDARIFAVVDVYDALISDRPYRPAWTKERAIENIKSLSGTHFDPRVVDAFVELLGQQI